MKGEEGASLVRTGNGGNRKVALFSAYIAHLGEGGRTEDELLRSPQDEKREFFFFVSGSQKN